jgi:gluconate kinase
MGRRNFLIEGVSCTGKTTVCTELQRRGHHAINGDTELAYVGDPATGLPKAERRHEHHLWRVDAVEALVRDREQPVSFFCGGSRNFSTFLHLFDGVFVLVVDEETLLRRLGQRPQDEFGGRPEERELIRRLHRTGEDVPTGVPVDATQPVAAVVDAILGHVAGFHHNVNMPLRRVTSEHEPPRATDRL